MRRYWIEAEAQKEDGDFLIEGEILHHIKDVCRQELGSRFELITDQSIAYFVEVVEVNKKWMRVKVVDTRTVEPLPRPWVHLAVSLPKFVKMDYIIEKSVELGVKSIQPFISDFSFIKKLSELTDNKRRRWEKIVVSATQQSGRGDLMSIAPLTNLENLLKNFNPSDVKRGLFFYEGDSSLTLRQQIESFGNKNVEDIWCFIGSEGGFSNREKELFEQLGYPSLTLGAQVLRVETACVVVASQIKYAFQ